MKVLSKQNWVFFILIGFCLTIAVASCGNDDDDNNDTDPTPEPQAHLELDFSPNPVNPVFDAAEQRYEWEFIMIIRETAGIEVELTLMSWLEQSNAERIEDFFGTHTVPGGGQIQGSFLIFKTLSQGGAGGTVTVTVYGIDALGNEVTVTNTLELLDYSGS